MERKERLRKLEELLKTSNMSEERKAEKRKEHAAKETEFLRLKRSGLGADRGHQSCICADRLSGKLNKRSALLGQIFEFKTKILAKS